jgi:hypothetical protein
VRNADCDVPCLQNAVHSGWTPSSEARTIFQHPIPRRRISRTVTFRSPVRVYTMVQFLLSNTGGEKISAVWLRTVPGILKYILWVKVILLPALVKWPTWCTIMLYKMFIIIILYMFRATLFSSSGGWILLTFWRRNYFFFLILAHPVYKMWIIQEQKR